MEGIKGNLLMMAREILAGSLRVHSAIPYFSSTKNRGLSEECDWAQDLVLNSKQGDKSALMKGAKVLAKHPKLRGFKGIVTAAPRSKAGRPSNMVVAKALVANGVGTSAQLMVIRKTPVESSRVRRHKGLGGVSLEEHVESMAFAGIPSSEPILIIDDVLTTGSTLKASARVIRQAGHEGPIIAATLGWFVRDPSKYKICPISYETKTV